MKNKYLDALRNLILFSAITHLGLLAIYSIVKSDVTHLNYFNILDVDLFFPNIATGPFSQVFSVISMMAIYFMFLYIFKKK